MKMLDQEIAPARLVAKQQTDLVERRQIDLTALRGLRRAALPPGSARAFWRGHWGVHCNLDDYLFGTRLNRSVKNNPPTRIA
jgi:hypothetical protein